MEKGERRKRGGGGVREYEEEEGKEAECKGRKTEEKEQGKA